MEVLGNRIRLALCFAIFTVVLLVSNTTRHTLASCSATGGPGQCEYCTVVECDGEIVRDSCSPISACS